MAKGAVLELMRIARQYGRDDLVETSEILDWANRFIVREMESMDGKEHQKSVKNLLQDLSPVSKKYAGVKVKSEEEELQENTSVKPKKKRTSADVIDEDYLKKEYV